MEELDRFQVLKSYAESIKTLAEADIRLAQELSYYIIQYWIYGAEPPKETNPIVLALFNQIKLPIETWRNLSIQNSINGKKGWRPVKNWENSQKANEKRTESEAKANGKQNIKIKNNKKEKDNNTNIILTNDTADKPAEYWNHEVNLCLELIKKYNWWLIDWTTTSQRRYSKLLIDKLNKLESIQNWKYTWNDTLEIILKVISQNKYYSSKITSPENIYRNLAVLMQKCKEDFIKSNNANTVLPTI